MNRTNYILPLKKNLSPSYIGNKAYSLLFLKKHRFNIPDTWYISTKTFEEYRNNGESIKRRLLDELKNFGRGPYAVRSSTTAEDRQEFSYAGQFQTHTNVSGSVDLLNAIEDVWKSATDGINSEYHSRSSVDEFKCAVIIQEMIRPRMAGVSFSKNPITGHNEIVIEAVEGPGESLVQKGITPMRWKMNKGKFLEYPENNKYKEMVRHIAEDTEKLSRKYRKHIDLEWVYDGDDIYYLQLRSITSKSDLPVYSNKMAQEMLPGQIYPLVWSVNIPMVNGTWIKLLSEITGPLNVQPEELARSFYYRMYFNIAALGKIFKKVGLSFDILPFLLTSDDSIKPSFRPGFRTLRHSFRAIRFVIHKLNFEKRFQREYNDLAPECQHLAEKVKNNFSLRDYPQIFDELFEKGKRLSYLNIVIPLLMQYYNKKLQKKLKKQDIEYEKIDFAADFPELNKYSPNHRIKEINELIDHLPREIRSAFASYKELSELNETRHIKQDIDNFIAEFGHFSESGNDFSVKKWEEDPEYVFTMILESGSNSKGTSLIHFDELTKDRIVRGKIKKLYRKAGKFRVYREQISSLFTFGCGLFRPLYLKLGKEFKEMSLLDDPGDIFLLSKTEIQKILRGKEKTEKDYYKELIGTRRKEMEDTKDYVLPSVIYGNDAPILEIGDVKNFKGVGTSPGTCSGRVRVIKRTSDFKKDYEGDILVIPFSDVGWTPILIKAGAIVSESGGMLSHCSIIARELGIPALVSVENACAILNGTPVTVDGSNGILTVHDHE